MAAASMLTGAASMGSGAANMLRGAASVLAGAVNVLAGAVNVLTDASRRFTGTASLLGGSAGFLEGANDLIQPPLSFLRTSKQRPKGKPMKNKNHRVLVSLHLPGPIGLLLSFARAVILAMTGNSHFLTPTPALLAVDGAVSDLEKAQSAVLARAKGALVPRDEKRAALGQLLHQLATYVQGIADADPANAAAIIQSAAMDVHKDTTHGKRPFAAKQGPASGSVKLVAPAAARRATYEWQWSTDGGKTWQSAPATSKSQTVLSGLPAGTVVSFRHRANTKAGEGQWSQTIALLVQ
jgi:hypothetical protein